MITFKQFMAETEVRQIYAKKFVDAPPWNPSLAENEYKIGEITFSAADGLGSVPNNANVNYMGFVGMMKPSTFMSVALSDDGQQEPTSLELEKLSKEGYAIGIPFLYVTFDEQGSATPKISGHEGRGRMRMVRRVNGDDPIPVHFFLRGGMRSRDITPEMVEALKTGVKAEQSETVVRNPVTHVYIDGQQK